MIKKRIVITALTAMLAASMSMPAFAAGETWLVDPNQYAYTTSNYEWQKAEGAAQAQKWANEHKDAILALSTETERFNAVVDTVCGFLTYDLNYKWFNPYYCIRDGKGVCWTYTILTKALCDAVNIPCEIYAGTYLNDAHNWVKVTVDGAQYYCDPTAVYAGLPQYRMSTSIWSDHTDVSGPWSLIDSIGGTSVGAVVDETLSTPKGMVQVNGGASGKPATYVTQADFDAFEAGTLSYEQLCEKYPTLK